MDAVELIALYSTLFYVFLGIAALGLTFSVFFFFYFDIPTTRAMMTGKAKQNTIRRMEEQNAKTGKLRFQYPSHTGEVSPRGHTGRTGRTGRMGRTERTGRTAGPQVAQPTPVAVEQEIPETSILGSTAYQQKEELEQTAMLHPKPSGFQFEVTESIVLIHTDEII